MMKEYQVTLLCQTKQYKPVSTIVKLDIATLFNLTTKEICAEIRKHGITKICQTRYWTTADLKKYNYTIVKMREYNKQKIEEEKKQKYEQIKKEKGWT